MIVFLAQLNPIVGDISGNLNKVFAALERAREKKAEIVLFSELVLSGYPPEDLLLDEEMIKVLEKALKKIAPKTKKMFVALGVPRKNRKEGEKPLLNSAAIFIDGKLKGFKDKTLLPTYDVFDESRFFSPGKGEKVFAFKGKKIAVTICEDVWQHAKAAEYTQYLEDPVLRLEEKRPDLVLNLSASPYYFKRREERIKVFQKAAKTLKSPLLCCNQVGANDQLVFDGASFCLNEKGEVVSLAKAFIEEDLIVDLKEKRGRVKEGKESIGDLYQALVLGTRDYFHKQGFTKGLIGLSGGIDSALVAAIAKEALGEDRVKALFLPSRFSSEKSFEDAQQLAKNLSIPLETIDIDPMYQSYLDLLGPKLLDKEDGVIEENLQPRIRAMILMAYSNRFGSILLNTGNKSEFAMGYTTLYGDMCGGIAVLLDVVKTKVYALARYVNREKEIIPRSILARPPSAELRPNQTDQDTLPPYEVLDLIIEDYVEKRLSPKKIALRRKLALPFIEEVIHKIHLAEYKRRQAPIGIRVSPKCFSKGRNIPVVQKWK